MTTTPSRTLPPLTDATRLLCAVVTIGSAAIGCTPTGPAVVPMTKPGTGSGPITEVCLHPGCQVDPGWTYQDCAAAEAGVEFFSQPIGTFEGPTAQYMYGYTDGTANTSANAGYQPATETAQRCEGVPNNQVFHLSGGPFLGWGGGIGVAMAHLNVDAGLCAAFPPPSYCPPPPVNNADVTAGVLSTLALDMSEWDGIALWARRGPDSQPLLRVLVGNKDTDDDIAYKMYTAQCATSPCPNNPTTLQVPLFCQRVRECGCQFKDAPCSHSDGDSTTGSVAGMYCGGAPCATPSYASMAPASGSSGCSNKCDTTMCNADYPAYPGSGDPQFFGRSCVPYTTRNGILSSYCYTPGSDDPPASGDQQCGDHFTFPLHLTTEWQFYLVPFNTMYQQGWAKKAAYFDLHSISVVRLTWDSGYIDYWIDDLRFYRAKR